MTSEDLAILGDKDAIDTFGKFVDLSFDRRDADGLRKAALLGRDLASRELDPKLGALLQYFLGNVWGFLRHLVTADPETRWEWEQGEAREEILAFRKALTHKGYPRLPRLRRCQVATNLGNLMSNVGRFVEALAYYDRALAEDANFGMALGNKGQCLLSYARALYDPGHQRIFAAHASDLLRKALDMPLEPNARPGFAEHLAFAEKASKDHACADREHLHAFSLGDGPEAEYRGWILRHRLFLHPVNDLGVYAFAARDILHLPTIVVPGSIGTGFHGFYNQLKQEYVAARALLFEACQQSDRHYADRDVGLLDTLDGTQYGLALERAKLAFRVAYSVLDKLAVFLARYFNIDEPLHKITFRGIWYMKGSPKKGLRPEFDRRRNWPLRGLFWLAKDLHEQDDEYHAAIEPGAREIATLRNQLEHQYAKITSPHVVWTPGETEVPPDPFAYRVERQDLDAKVTTLLGVARCALIYLSLAVHAEERERPRRAEDVHAVSGSLRRIE